VSNDWQNDPRLSHPHLHAGLQAIVCSPLIEGDTTLGALWIGRTAPIEHDDLRLLTAIADMAATAIHRATLLDQTLRQVSRLGALRELDTAIMSSFDLQLTLDVLLKQVRTHLEVDAAAVLLLDPHSLYLEAAAWIGYRGKGPSGLRLRLGEGFGGQAALDRQVVHVPELTEDDPRIDKRGMVAEEGFAALISLPLIAKGRVSGVLEVFHRSPLPVHPEWLDFLETLAGQAAIAIEDARLYEDLQQSNLELTLAYDTTIEGWSRALDLRDKETEGHSRRVTELTLRLARGMGIGEAELVHIRRGALLHDIGKMGVPDQILLKPGPLTDAEWAIMTKHPVYAHELLAPIAYLRPALDIPHDHHEKWDGSGYPRGLKGDAIPLAARIFAVADVWDALRSDRPYRPTWTKEKALEYIVAESGRHFDPAVVEAFLEILDE
jgi:putative nucleotidyltransferase with HDIG domain